MGLSPTGRMCEQCGRTFDAPLDDQTQTCPDCAGDSDADIQEDEPPLTVNLHS